MKMSTAELQQAWRFYDNYRLLHGFNGVSDDFKPREPRPTRPEIGTSVLTGNVFQSTPQKHYPDIYEML